MLKQAWKKFQTTLQNFEDGDDDIYEIECPECGELVYADGETLDETDVYCPNCHKMLEVEIPDDEEDED